MMMLLCREIKNLSEESYIQKSICFIYLLGDLVIKLVSTIIVIFEEVLQIILYETCYGLGEV